MAAGADGTDGAASAANASGAVGPEGGNRRTIIGFLQLLVEIGQRIAMSLTIQLVAASVSTRQSLRLVRILTLFSVAVLFLFLQSGAAVVLAQVSDLKKTN